MPARLAVPAADTQVRTVRSAILNVSDAAQDGPRPGRRLEPTLDITEGRP